jgi:hypothetical protein
MSTKIRKKTDYEWRVEVDGDDLIPADSYDEALSIYDDEIEKGADEEYTEIVLVRDINEFDEEGSHSDRVDTAFATVEDGVLDSRFDNGVRVPMKFHREVARAEKNR